MIPSPIFITTERYTVKIAETLSEIQQALQLRYEVFNLEMNEGLSSSHELGFDSDIYDTFCDHLLVIENASQNVVGTYRLLRQDKAEAHIGFYSEGEFDLSQFKLLSGNSLEVGRSCVAKEHRSSAVINLLWNGISAYLHIYKISRLFGCVSLHTKNMNEVAMITEYIRTNYFAPTLFRVQPLVHTQMQLPYCDPLAYQQFDSFRSMPPLMKGYFRLGAMVCGEPAYDKEFGTIDFFIVVERERITERYRTHYLERNTQTAA